MNSLFRNNLKSVLNLVKDLNKHILPIRNEAKLLATQSEIKKPNVENDKYAIDVCNHVNKAIQDPRSSRLFAVVMIGGSQFKITTEDVITVKNYFYPTIGDRIKLEKVLLVGGKDFTVIGKPMLDQQFVSIEATVIEKTLSNNIILFTYKPRKDNRRMRFHKNVLTHLRINSIEITGAVPTE